MGCAFAVYLVPYIHISKNITNMCYKKKILWCQFKKLQWMLKNSNRGLHLHFFLP